MKKILTTTKKCRLCGSKNLFAFLNLEKISKQNAEAKITPPNKIPKLKMIVCKNYWHVQAGSVPLPDFYVNDYTYHTRFSKTMVEHFKQRAKSIINKFKVKSNDLVIDIGGNDGTFLNNFKKFNKKIETLCVDPTLKTTQFAKKKGINVFLDFFNLKNSNSIKKKYGTPKIILCTNTFGAINDMKEFVSGLKNIMDKNTIFIYENPYLLNTFKGVQFDTMYYEHISYFAVSPMSKFFKTFNLEIFDYSKSKIHGGSMMVFVRKNKNFNKKNLTKINKIINIEKKYGFNTVVPYKKFSDNVKNIKFKEKPTIQDPINLGYFLFRKNLIKNIKSQSLWVKFLENLSKSGKFTTTVTDKKYFSFDNPVEYNQVKKKIIK